MQLSDITVEVRDKNLTRIGMIRPEELDLELSDLHNNVGSWRLRLGAEHPLAGALRQPGSGIVVTGRDGTEIFSGPMVKQENAATADDPAGTITFEGVSDSVVLADHLAFPDPTNIDPTTQTRSHDVRTGPTETLMHAYVNANIGPGAPAARRKANLVMGVDLGRGTLTTKSARFKVLGTLLEELAVVDNLGFRVIQRGNQLAFETYQVQDRSAEIRLDVYNNTLAGHRVAISPPGATQVIVAGQDEGVDRQFRWLNTPESVAAEIEWGRRIERFVDQRQTDNVDELDQAGMEVLTKEGFSTLAVQAVPMEDSAMEFGRDWYLGDRITVVVEGQELSSTVTGLVIKANREGFRVGALIGDPAGFDVNAALGKRVTEVEKRVSELERNVEVDPTLDTRLDSLESARALPENSITEAATPDAYPLGVSVLSISDNNNWTPATHGTIVTFKHSTVRCTQIFHRNEGNDMWKRSYHTNNPGGGWSTWSKVAFDSSVTVTKTGALTAGNWYRIGTLTGVEGEPTGAKATGVWTIRTNASGQHASIRLRVGYAFDDREGQTIFLEEYSGYSEDGWVQPFSQARLVPIGSTYDGAHLEILCTSTPADFEMTMTLEPGEWKGGNGWQLVNMADVGTTENVVNTVGLYWTGRWTALPLVNGWANYVAPYPWAEFRMLPGSLVKVRGVIRNGTASTTISTFPVGARTRHQLSFCTIAGSNSLGRVDVYNDGRLGHVAGANSYLSLDTITYVAEW